MKRLSRVSFAICVSVLLAACGNGGGGNHITGNQQPAATHFSVAAAPSATSGTDINFSVTALDASNNAVTMYAGTVRFTSTDSQAVLPANSTLTNGTGTFSATLETTGNQTITATDTVTLRITGVSNPIQVSSPPPTGKFTTTGGMEFARAEHTATLLQDGTVLIIGGENSTGPLATAEIFDPTTGMFTPTTGMMETPRVGHTATLLTDGKVLVTGGDDVAGALATAEIFDPATGMFTPTTGMMETPRVGHTATLLNDGSGRVLVAGGAAPLGAGGGTLSGELFDPRSGNFTPADNEMSAGRAYHTATLLPSGEVLLAGGTASNTNATGQGDLFEPASATFVATANQGTTALYLAAALLEDGRVLVAGGQVGVPLCGAGGGGVSTDTAFLFDGSDASFSATANMSVSRFSHTATQLGGGEVLIAGGDSSSWTCNRGFPKIMTVPVASAELFDPAGTFTLTTDMSTPRAEHTATLLGDGKVLLVGGVDAHGDFLASAELFQ